MTAVRLQRRIPAAPDEVYRAWLDPDLLRRWLAPAGLEVMRAEVDGRVGGHYRIWHAGAEGEVGGFECELLELVPSERIVLRWGFVGPDRLAGPKYDSQLTVTLREAPDGATELTLVHERLDDLREALPKIAEGVGPGWEMALDKLAAMGRGGARMPARTSTREERLAAHGRAGHAIRAGDPSTIEEATRDD